MNLNSVRGLGASLCPLYLEDVLSLFTRPIASAHHDKCFGTTSPQNFSAYEAKPLKVKICNVPT